MATLPLPPNAFIGRRQEMELASDLLRRPELRLLVMTGPPGVGKTRLALEVVRSCGDALGEVCFVDLAPVNGANQFLSILTAELKLPDDGRPALQRLTAFLRPRRMSLVLDNFETVITAARDLGSLLAACSRLTVVVTSRARLHLSWEHLFPVEPLSLPSTDDGITAERAAESEAVGLFVVRAQGVDPRFALTESTTADVVMLCRRLEGIPLAIELAAARVGALSPATLVAQLGSALSLLTGGPVDVPDRLQTMRDTIAWSYDLLTSGHRTLFRRLAVFAGGFTVEAAQAVADKEESSRAIADLLDGLNALVDQSLLVSSTAFQTPGRFRLLEVIREFALDRLTAASEVEATRRGHADYFLAYALGIHPRLYTPDFRQAMRLLVEDQDNFRAVLTWAGEHAETDVTFQLCHALQEFWYQRGLAGEGRRWIEQALAVPGPPSAVRLMALSVVGLLAWVQGDDEAAFAYQSRALGIYEQVGHPLGIAWCHTYLGLLAWRRGDGDGMLAHAETAHAGFRSLSDQVGESVALIVLALAARQRGDVDRAREIFTQARDLAVSTGFVWVAAAASYALGELALMRETLADAAEEFGASLAITAELGDRWGIGAALAGLAGIAAARSEVENAARLLGAADRLLAEATAFLPTLDRTAFDRRRTQIRDALGGGAYRRLMTAGRALSLDEATILAERVISTSMHSASSSPVPRLTERQMQVLGLVAKGLTNKEIAIPLAITPRTVSFHLDQLFHLFGVHTRAGLVARVIRAGVIRAEESAPQ